MTSIVITPPNKSKKSLESAFDRSIRSFFCDGTVESPSLEPLSADEEALLETALDDFRRAWHDRPLLEYAREFCAAATPSMPKSVRFVAVDYVGGAISLQHLRFVSRRLYVERSSQARSSSSPFRHNSPVSIDLATRDYLARARVTMRFRTLDYHFDDARLVLSATNVVVGYVM